MKDYIEENDELEIALPERKIIGERFLKERERLGLSQQKFGELVGLKQAGVNAVEKEYRTAADTLRSTSVEKFIRSAETFKCSLDYLADLTDDRRSVNEILEELEGYKKRGIMIVPTSAEQGALLSAILEEAKRLPEYELRMVAMLCKRLVETTTKPTTNEATEAARIIDKLPPEQRAAALAAVQGMEEQLKNTADELKDRLAYILELVADVSGIDARAEVEARLKAKAKTSGETVATVK